MSKTESKENRLSPAVSVLGPLISLVAVLVTVYGDLAPGERRIALGALVVMSACSVYAVFGQRCALAVRRTAKAIRQHCLVPRYFGRFESFVERLDRLCDRDYSDNIPHVLRDITQSWRGPFTDLSALDYFRGLVGTLHVSMAHLRRNKSDFELLLRWFGQMLALYNRQFVCEPVNQVLMRLRQGLEEEKKAQYEHLRQEYQKVKLGYVMFLEQYADFARDLNTAFGENIARDYFERPGEL